MNSLLINVVIKKITDSGRQVNISSLLFTEKLTVDEAKKIAVYHIYHLHVDDQKKLPTINSVQFTENDEVVIDQQTSIFVQSVREVTKKQTHVIGRLGLFGYNKKLKYVSLTGVNGVLYTRSS